MRADAAEWYYKEKKNLWRSRGLTEAQMRTRAKQLASKSVRRCGNEWAVSLSDDDPHKFWYSSCGVSLNEKHFKEKQFDATVKAMNYAASDKSKWHPQGAGAPKGTYDHEMGHQLDHLLNIRSDAECIAYRRALSKDEINEGAYRLAFKNEREFPAETWAV